MALQEPRVEYAGVEHGGIIKFHVTVADQPNKTVTLAVSAEQLVYAVDPAALMNNIITDAAAKLRCMS